MTDAMAHPPTKVIGIDPGTRHLGWGVITREGSRVRHVDSGTIHTTALLSLERRLLEIDEALEAVLARYEPTHAAVETLFFHKDAQAASKLGHARGVVLLACARRGIAVSEYQPAKVKRTLAGRGQAEKRQVALMVKAILGLESLPGEDATDALAIAITHSRTGGFERALADDGAVVVAATHPLRIIEQEFRKRRASRRR